MDFEKFWNWFCRFCLIAFILICINSLLGDLIFRIQYSFPKISETTYNIINVREEPKQISVSKNEIVKVYGEKRQYRLDLQAEYTISGLVVAKNNNFWFRDLMRSDFDDVCLIDFGIVWGDLAVDSKRLNKHMKFKSTKTLGQARALNWRTKPPYNKVPWGIDYISSHIAHTHMIPANPNIMSALLSAKKGEYIKLDGYLVDIYSSDGQIIARTSLSRFDNNATSRGYGACEDMYVKRVQIGNKIYY